MSPCAVVKAGQGRQFFVGKRVYWWDYGVERNGVLHSVSRHGDSLKLEIRVGAKLVYKDSGGCSH